MPSIRGRTCILASRSPRRRELLAQLVPGGAIQVWPPRDSRERAFEGLSDLPAIERRLIEIARGKAADVWDQVAAADSATAQPPLVIAADTVIVVQDLYGRLHVLGQPPEDDRWRDVVGAWFREYYAGRSHVAVTALCVQHAPAARAERVVRTEVTFTDAVENRLEWYLATGEPRGKAGGYAIQGAGSVFVTNVSGSLSNVIGLPLEALQSLFEELSIDVGALH